MPFDSAMENRIRANRLEAGGITQQELADRVGVTRQTIISIEKGRYRPSVDLAVRIARVFGRPVEEIFIVSGETHAGKKTD